MGILNRVKIIKLDSYLIIALISGFIFCLYGIHWGRVEEWNPDQMVFKGNLSWGEIFSSPSDFLKPPFHTYFNFILSYIPLKFIEKIFRLSQNSLTSGSVMLIWSRIISASLFLGTIFLNFQINKRFFGLFSARIITLIFATSSGFIVYSHFLTADIPLIFWMILSFYFIQSIYLQGKISNYLLAGFFTGIATATKYNGLSIGIGIVLAHILSFNELAWKKIIFSKKLILSLLTVVIGFLIGNPFALINYRQFVSDFLYNYITTPIYNGEITGTNYLTFFSIYIREIVGLPSLIIISLAILYSLYLTFTSKDNKRIKSVLLILTVFIIYYYKFADFPRLETRFVLPIVPFWLMLSGPFWNQIKSNKAAISVILVIIISYNTVCSLYVGKRFLDDPRMVAQEWVKANIPQLSLIENTAYIPTWNRLSGVKLKSRNMPFISGRGKLFEQNLTNRFKKDSWIIKRWRESQKSDQNINFYSQEELANRKPEYIAINSLYYERFFKNDNLKILYPEINQFFTKLISEKYPYKRIFDQESKTPPIWAYPQNIDFLHNRTIIFKGKDS
ncbi:ArnT family glycosyltransferase [Nostoc sp. UHCC 0870]|uniref:ArnT family glycosyltransferase n=1 Tax=Nostoc sp. UHCC 0870 TaxID=2914041 RepID=UPI001EDDB243|nr:phospholipid carrier-dependent glycosyltransferase [Nostoc sp. UHCC 0870]UKO99497.1 glycosyltransferase family 39 protein [Nostoc sp. UHCC 0870]